MILLDAHSSMDVGMDILFVSIVVIQSFRLTSLYNGTINPDESKADFYVFLVKKIVFIHETEHKVDLCP